MKHSGFSLSLSEIKFELDEQAQESIVNNVTEKVVEAVLKALSDKGLLNLSSLSVQPSQAVKAEAPAAIATPAKRGRRPKVRVEEVAAEPKAPATVQAPAAVQSPAVIQSPVAVQTDSSALLVDAEVAQMRKITPSLALKDAVKLRTELTKFKLSPTAQDKLSQEEQDKVLQTAQDFFKEIGFNTLYDLLVYRATHKPTIHVQEFAFIDAFIDAARLKEFVEKAAVKRYMKKMIKPKRGRVAKTIMVARHPGTPITKDTLFDALDISTTLKSYVRKEGVVSVNDAILYCNEVKLGDLLLKGATNKHSMIYQLVKFLRASGLGTSPMKRFQKKIEEDSDQEKSKKKVEKVAAAVVEVQAEPEAPDYKEELKAANYYNLNETEMAALFSEVTSYDFPEKMGDTFTKNKIQAMFELLYFVAGISRKFFSEEFRLNINELKRVEKILIDAGFINSIDKLTTLSYCYESKYYHFIRHFRNRVISDKKVPLSRFNKNLTESEQDALYINVVDMGFSDRVLSILKQGKIPTAISLLSFMIYGCDTANTEIYTSDVINEITDVLDHNGLHKYKFASYVKGLRKYYFKSSLYFQKKKTEEAAAVAEASGGPTTALAGIAAAAASAAAPTAIASALAAATASASKEAASSKEASAT